MINIAPIFIKIVPFESSHLDESNHNNFIKFGLLIIKSTTNFYKYLKLNNFVNIDPIKMQKLPFESSHRDGSNGGLFIKFESLDAKIIIFEVLYNF